MADASGPDATTSSDAKAYALEPTTPPPSATLEAGDLAGQVQRVQSTAGRLSEPRWTVACGTAADALHALADTLRALDPADGKVRRAARHVWADARALDGACTGGFEAADYMRNGLQASLKGLERAMDVDDMPRLRARVDLARRLVEALDPGISWVFQRARVQDAFRTVSNAFVVAAESRPRCAVPEWVGRRNACGAR